MNGDVFSWSLRVGTIWGICVRIHWILLLFWLFRLDSFLKRGAPVWIWVLATFLSFTCILLHEFGHCFAARSVGGSANEVVLWPLGGLALCHTPNHWRPRFIVAAGGPLVTFSLLSAVFVLSRFAPELTYESQNDYLWAAYQVLVRWQLILLVFNLLPLYPLDGGLMFYMGLWGLLTRYGRRYDSYVRATIATLWASRIVAVIGAVYALVYGELFLMLLFFWAWINAETLKRLAAQEMATGTYLGYDFSQGYTSLERGQRQRQSGRSFLASIRNRLLAWPGRLRRSIRRLVRRRPRRPAGDRPNRGAAERIEPWEMARVDQILAKISREGEDSLTHEERSFLQDMSRRWRSDT